MLSWLSRATCGADASLSYLYFVSVCLCLSLMLSTPPEGSGGDGCRESGRVRAGEGQRLWPSPGPQEGERGDEEGEGESEWEGDFLEWIACGAGLLGSAGSARLGTEGGVGELGEAALQHPVPPAPREHGGDLDGAE